MDEACWESGSLTEFVFLSQLTRLNRGESVLWGALTLSLPESKGKGRGKYWERVRSRAILCWKRERPRREKNITKTWNETKVWRKSKNRTKTHYGEILRSKLEEELEHVCESFHYFQHLNRVPYAQDFLSRGIAQSHMHLLSLVSSGEPLAHDDIRLPQNDLCTRPGHQEMTQSTLTDTCRVLWSGR